MEKRRQWVRAALSGAAAGAVGGLFGGSGGMLLIPLLIHWCKLPERQAFATGMCIMLPLCGVSALVYGLRGGLDLMEALPYLVGGFFGGVVAGKIFVRLPMPLLRKSLALFILYGGVRALFFT